MKKEKDIQTILLNSKKLPVNRNERFWMDAVEFLGSISKTGGHPDFLISWVKEVLNIIKDEKKINIYLVVPEDGCRGILIEGKDDYLFSYNVGQNIYISYRLYSSLKEKNAYNLLSGLLLHEIAEFIMRIKAEKKGFAVSLNKNHGEALRLEKTLLGKGKYGETLLTDLFNHLAEMEIDRRKVILDKQDIFVEGCAISGEETMAEINSRKHRDESFILQLTPGQKKTLPYSGGYFTAQAENFYDPFKLEQIDFKEYCNLMKIMDDFFIEESVINDESPFGELLLYIRKLNFYKEQENQLLKILWLFTKRFIDHKNERNGFLYNVFLLIDEYISYFIMKEIAEKDYWKIGKFVKDNLEEVINSVYKRKQAILPGELYIIKQDKERIRERLIEYFSDMKGTPLFSQIESIKWIDKIPHNITKYYKKVTAPSIISEYQKDIFSELSMHEQVLGIIKILRSLMTETRFYHGVKKAEDTKIYELNMMRVHFWKDRNLFTRGETVGLYSIDDNRGFGTVEIIDVKEYSVVVFLKEKEIDIPETGFIKKLEEEDLPLNVSLDAIHRVKNYEGIVNRLLKAEVKVRSFGSTLARPIKRGGASTAEVVLNSVEDCKKTVSPGMPGALAAGKEGTAIPEPAVFFNSAINSDNSQCEAVKEGLGSSNITLIQGPPGTGKTTVIAEIILQSLKLGKRVLLSSQTNNAVDNALKDVIKWKDKAFGVGRVASTQEKIVDPNIKDIWIKSTRELEEFENEYENLYVIGATNVGTHTLNVMRGREFSVLVMDEAGKSNLVESILPMFLLKENGKLIIVGDHKQGSPFEYDEDVIYLLVKRESELHTRLKITKDLVSKLKENLNQSLFERLIETKHRSILLKKNYRSSPQIVELISKLFYNGEIISAKEQKEKTKSVIIVDTSKRAGINERKETEVIIEGEGRGYKNTFEANLIVEELKELLKYRYIATGIKQRHVTGVTILAPYIFQVEEIRKQLSIGMARRLPGAYLDDLLDNVTTIDSFQGREDDIIIISFTRSNDNPSEVGFLNELNRINVALSRAKRKMVLIGDFSTLMNTRKGSNASYVRKIFRTIYEIAARG